MSNTCRFCADRMRTLYNYKLSTETNAFASKQWMLEPKQQMNYKHSVQLMYKCKTNLQVDMCAQQCAPKHNTRATQRACANCNTYSRPSDRMVYKEFAPEAVQSKSVARNALRPFHSVQPGMSRCTWQDTTGYWKNQPSERHTQVWGAPHAQTKSSKPQVLKPEALSGLHCGACTHPGPAPQWPHPVTHWPASPCRTPGSRTLRTPPLY